MLFFVYFSILFFYFVFFYLSWLFMLDVYFRYKSTDLQPVTTLRLFSSNALFFLKLYIYRSLTKLSHVLNLLPENKMAISQTPSCPQRSLTTLFFPYGHSIRLQLFLLWSQAEKNEKKHTEEGCSFFWLTLYILKLGCGWSLTDIWKKCG